MVTNSVGANVKYLVDRPDDEHCFRLHKDRVFYVSVKTMVRATNISRENLRSLGICMGKVSTELSAQLASSIPTLTPPFCANPLSSTTGLAVQCSSQRHRNFAYT